MWTLYLPMRLELFNTCYILTASGKNVLSGASGRVDKWQIDINVRSSLSLKLLNHHRRRQTATTNADGTCRTKFVRQVAHRTKSDLHRNCVLVRQAGSLSHEYGATDRDRVRLPELLAIKEIARTPTRASIETVSGCRNCSRSRKLLELLAFGCCFCSHDEAYWSNDDNEDITPVDDEMGLNWDDEGVDVGHIEGCEEVDYENSEEEDRSLSNCESNDREHGLLSDSEDEQSFHCSKSNPNEMIEITVGQEFDNVQHFRRVLENYVIKNGFDLNRIKNEKRRFRAKCSNEGCPWFIYAALVESGTKFRIQKLNNVHECNGVLESKEASYKWIASQFEGTLKNNSKMPVKAMKDELVSNLGIKASMKKMYRAKKRAMDKLNGNYANSYQRLRDYAQLLKQRNPNTLVKMKFVSSFDKDRILALKFQRFMLSFAALKNGFINGCRRFIGLDGCHLNGLFGECADSWKWFLAILTARATSEKEWEDNMKKIKTAKKDTQAAYDYLIKINKKQWARHAFPDDVKVDHVTNNLTESWNSWLNEYRDKPVLTLMEFIQKKVMKRLYKRHSDARKWIGKLPPTVRRKLIVSRQEGRYVRVLMASEYEFEVMDENNKIFIVNMQNKTCDCGVYQICGIPCKHIIPCIALRHEDAADYVDKKLTVEAYLATYANIIHPLPYQSTWAVVEGLKILPPYVKIRAGRPKIVRKRKPGEEQGKRKTKQNVAVVQFSAIIKDHVKDQLIPLNTPQITLRSSNTFYRTCALSMDIFNDEMVRVVLHMASDVANYGCIHIFVTTSPRVPSEDLEPPVETETFFRANMSGLDIEEEALAKTMSLQQYYSPIHDNNDNIDDNRITDVGEEVLPLTTSLEQLYSPYHNNNFCDNDDLVDDISNIEADNVFAEPANSIRGSHFNNADDDGGVRPSNIPSFQHDKAYEDDIPVNNRDNRSIPPMAGSRKMIDPLTSLAPILPLNMVAPSFLSSCDSDDISVGKLFADKNELILLLRKVTFMDKFDFKIARSTTTHFETHCYSESCKWCIRAIRNSNEHNGPWVVRYAAGIRYAVNIPVENNNVWEWFIMKLHGVIGNRPELKNIAAMVYDRKIVVESMNICLTTWVDEIVTEMRTMAEKMIVHSVSPHRFQVVGGGIKEGLIDIKKKKTCSSRVFQLDQLVYAYAIVACLTVRVDYINFCSDFYTKESLAMAYAQSVEPVGNVGD
ncbi:SWIM-type domain-containing protein [Citrus sinensis]|nr:SWIM-type domain-containing protein [Citrus sinensis]